MILRGRAIRTLVLLLSLGSGLLVTAADASAESVRDFGAVGDGVADDSDAIRRAVAESKTGRLEFPRGDYRITRTIEVDLTEISRLSLDGMGGVGRVTMAGPGPAFRFVGSHRGTANPAGFSDATWQNERMPQVDGLEILGDHPEADGIEFERVMQPTLRGVLIRDVRNGVILSTRNRNLVIDACHLYNLSGIGVFFDRVNLHQAIIQGSHISYCKRGGIKIVDGEIRNFQITGNDIEYNYDRDEEASADICFDLRDGTVAEGTITSNTIQAQPSPGGANIRFIGPENPEHRTPMSMWTITGNVIGSQQVNLHLVRCRGMAITGNHIYTGQQRTVVMEACRNLVFGPNSLDQSHNEGRGFTNGVTLRDCDAVTLSGLILDRCAAGDEEAGGAIDLFDSREVIVANCQILDPRFRGIYADGNRNLQLTGNTIVATDNENPTDDDKPTDEEDAEDGGESTMIAAIEVRRPIGVNLVRDNLVGEGTAGDVVTDGDGVIVRGNERP